MQIAITETGSIHSTYADSAEITLDDLTREDPVETSDAFAEAVLALEAPPQAAPAVVALVSGPEDAVTADLDWAEGWSAEDPRLTPIRRAVPKLTVVDRLEAAGLFEVAMTALGGPGSLLYERWSAANEVYADDPDLISLLTAIGADPEEILA